VKTARFWIGGDCLFPCVQIGILSFSFVIFSCVLEVRTTEEEHEGGRSYCTTKHLLEETCAPFPLSRRYSSHAF
jgi:hypothetical protein